MPCKPLELLEVAKHLAQLKIGGEASHRGATSRAYYAALHCVKQTFPERAEEYQVAGESSHAEIISRAVAVSRQNVPGRGPAATIAHMMPKLRRMRNQADYDLGEVYDQSACTEVLLRATKVVDLCADVERLRMNAKGQ